MKSEDCEKLKNVLEEVRGAISKHTMQLGKVQAEDHLYEGTMLPLRSFDGKDISSEQGTRLSASGKLLIL